MYTAIAGQFETEEAAAQFAAAVQEICQLYGYQVIVNNPDFDYEVSEGVRVFQEKMGLNLLLCLNYPAHRRIKVSSDLIYLELGYQREPKYAGKEANFAACILRVNSLPTPNPIKLYYLFSFEWPKDRYIRLKTGSAAQLITYLEANGWYWAESLYDVAHGTYHLELDTPLVFQITR
ncbi:hypothetical protein [Hymenobacter edaphi]|uniref:Uncharacterized protein n=1 Tax=Hymenobacter edaphi TaxID=2211146 RepID=A0A328B9Y5_9BACT|nr:hypothetical protein [Hymenobacter edaphi]RAK63963.1 hypothetical protein DLM85_20705 [Hymenobacter edaphi]